LLLGCSRPPAVWRSWSASRGTTRCERTALCLVGCAACARDVHACVCIGAHCRQCVCVCVCDAWLQLQAAG
jgi:hypothetical protein